MDFESSRRYLSRDLVVLDNEQKYYPPPRAGICAAVVMLNVSTHNVSNDWKMPDWLEKKRKMVEMVLRSVWQLSCDGSAKSGYFATAEVCFCRISYAVSVRLALISLGVMATFALPIKIWRHTNVLALGSWKQDIQSSLFCNSVVIRFIWCKWSQCHTISETHGAR